MKTRLKFFAIVFFTAASAAAQLNENCVVSILNRTARAQADGGWVIANVPAGAARVRARATCVENGVTRTGQSDYFNVPVSGIVQGIKILFDAPKPDPATLQLTASSTVLRTIGNTAQLLATATFPDNTTRDVTTAEAGTVYTTSNPAIATVSAGGVVTATGSGTAIISAMNEGALALIRLTIAGAADSDGDGMPDDFEIANGLNPNNPADAALDADSDGLSNLEEFRNGTGVHNPDSDGDGVRDGLEVQTGSDPLDPTSFNLARALRSVAVRPANVVLRVNPLFGEASAQLTVTGTMLDGATINLTARNRGTAYSSTDLTICNFSSVDGEILAGNAGQCTVSVASNGFTVPVPASVETYQPRGITSIVIPGYANNVKVKAGFAYVAAGSAGLQVVDVQDPAAPSIAGSLALDGVAIDLRIRDNLIFVACGDAGVRVVDITSPTLPHVVGAITTQGVAQDIWLDGNFAYVANGLAGLKILDISTPAAPVAVASVPVGTARGVAVEGGIAAVAMDTGIAVVDVSVPQSARQVGAIVVQGSPKDVVMRDGFAFVASFDGGLQIVDLRSPASPKLASQISDAFAPRDVILSGQFAVLAEQKFPNAIPFVDVRIPTTPVFRGIIDLEPIADYAATGIDVSGRNVFLTEESFVVTADFGTTGDTRLFIAEYQTYSDTSGIAPTVRIVSPVNGQNVIAGSREFANVEAADDIAVAQVSLVVDGVVASTGTGSPANLRFSVPPNASSLTLTARAIDFGNNSAASAPVTVNVIPDPLTNVLGFVKDDQGHGVGGATVSLGTLQTTTGPAGDYRFDDVPTISGNYVLHASGQLNGKPATGTSAAVAPVRGGTTTIPDIIVRSTVWFVQPLPGTNFVIGDMVNVEVDVAPDFPFAYLSIFVGDVEWYRIFDQAPPFRAPVFLPADPGPVTLTAVAYDLSGTPFESSVVVNVIPDPLTTATGVVKNEAGRPVANVTVKSGAIASMTDASGAYQLRGIATLGTFIVTAHVTIGSDKFAGRSGAVVPVRGGISPVPDIVLTKSFCGEDLCVENQGMYVSHYTDLGCQGTESYYLPYDNFGYLCRSWDAGGECGTIHHTVTNRSARINGGPCEDLWPSGNTLDDFVTIYRPPPPATP